MLYAYSVAPLADNEFEARVSDIIKEVKRKTFYMPLFSMTLVPEGNPVWDKAGKMAKLYAKYRARLNAEGIESGILVQASLGHGYTITPNPFQPVIGFVDGVETYVCCPEDERFIEHFCSVLRTLAMEKPKAIMLDDDFRLLMRPGRGCACKRHMEIFNRRAGTSFAREDLLEHVRTHNKKDPLTVLFAEIQRDSLIKAATAFRAAIDTVDPTIQGINCTSGAICESVIYTNKIFAGNGNPTMVRIPNGIYAPESIRGFAALMRKTAICSSKIRKGGIDIVLSETDTIPFNRYAKSARYLHSHYTVSVLDGLSGAKHWITRMSAFEPSSGAAYRDILSKHAGMYERLLELSAELRWVGCNSAFTESRYFDFNKENLYQENTGRFAEKFFERIGVPFYFSDSVEKATFLESDIVNELSDTEINALFEGSVFMDGDSAKLLTERGFSHLLGVSAEEWSFGTISGETFDGTPFQCCTGQKNPKKLTVTDRFCEVLSHNYLHDDDRVKLLSPAVTVLEREKGKLSVVFCGSPDVRFSYTEGFAFLNESRKAQLVSLLHRAGALPIYLVGDDEVCLRAGYLNDGTLLATIIELGIDPINAPTVYLEKEPAGIEIMLPDGTSAPIAFERKDDRLYTLDVRVETLYPVILLIKPKPFLK